jgi:hypothetical protein
MSPNKQQFDKAATPISMAEMLNVMAEDVLGLPRLKKPEAGYVNGVGGASVLAGMKAAGHMLDVGAERGTPLYLMGGKKWHAPDVLLLKAVAAAKGVPGPKFGDAEHTMLHRGVKMELKKRHLPEDYFDVKLGKGMNASANMKEANVLGLGEHKSVVIFDTLQVLRRMGGTYRKYVSADNVIGLEPVALDELGLGMADLKNSRIAGHFVRQEWKNAYSPDHATAPYSQYYTPLDFRAERHKIMMHNVRHLEAAQRFSLKG